MEILSVEILLMKTSAMGIVVTWQVRGVWTMNWNIFWKVTPATEKIWRRLPVSFLWSDLCRIMHISETDPEKKAEAEAAALTLCTVIGLPELAEGAAQGILLAWAYGEAIMDIRTLISGGKVPLVKNAEDWKLSLSGLMQLGSAGENVAADSGKDMESGLAYREYLRMLLFLKSQDEVGMRTLDMVEQNLKIRYGQTFFRADACISRVEFHSTCNLRRGIMYDFPTYFGYN